jgi:polyisoprenoid-binding protein YceI
MTITRTPAGPTDSIPIAGAWRVDGGQSRARFVAATLRGAAKVRGEFSSLSGSAVVGAEGASGTLTIEAASVDTGNRLRDLQEHSFGMP